MLAAALLSFSQAKAQVSNDYIVSTEQVAPQGDSTAVNNVNTESMTAEERFLHDNFPYLSMCNWQEGMRFMVVPNDRDMIVRTFTDSISGREISSGELRYKIMEYRGHETTDRGWFRMNFYCQDNKKAYYYEVRNFTFEEYCSNVQGGVPSLAYLGDVDKARELLIGKELWLKLPTVYRDRQNSSRGYEEKQLHVDTHVTVTQVGVGTREYPVKIIFSTDNGDLYFQSVAMSMTNSGMLDEEFVTTRAHHYFANAFSIGSDTDASSANMAQRLKGMQITTRHTTKMNHAGSMKDIGKGTLFKVLDITAVPNSDFYTLRLSTKTGTIYRKDVTWQKGSTNGNASENADAYFPELFTVNPTRSTDNNQGNRLGHESLISPTPQFMHIMGGIVETGMSKEDVRLAKGDPDKTHKLANGGVQWDYNDGTKVVFGGNGRVRRVIR